MKRGPAPSISSPRRTPSCATRSPAHLAVVGLIGIPRAVAAAPKLALPLGYDVEAALDRLDTVRVIDALAVHTYADGEIEVAHLSNLSKGEAIELGTKIGALIGQGAGTPARM